MNQQLISLAEKKLIGIQVRTNNKNEMDPLTGKIFPIIRRFFHEKLSDQIPSRISPETTFCCYTDYESDHHGDYTYFIGEEVSSLEDIPSGFESLVIPGQAYTKFTSGPAPMPDVVRNAWFAIWKMNEKELGGKRSYITDFEIYDERAKDHSNIVMDLFIGLVE